MWGLDADNCEDGVQPPGQQFDTSGDVGAADEAEQADRDVAGGRHELGRRAGSDLGAIFVEGSVPDVMFAVFDAPVAAVSGEHVGRVGLPGGEAGDPVDGFGFADRLFAQAEGFPVDAERLIDVGEVDAGDVAGAPDGTQLDPAVAAVMGGVVRGGKSPPLAGSGGTGRPGRV